MSCDDRVDEAERLWVNQDVADLRNLGAFGFVDGARLSVTRAVQCQYRRLVEARDEICSGRVRQMVVNVVKLRGLPNTIPPSQRLLDSRYAISSFRIILQLAGLAIEPRYHVIDKGSLKNDRV